LRERNFRLNFPEKAMLRNSRARAKKKDIPFNLDLSDIVIPEVCPILGIPMLQTCSQYAAAPNSPSIDRIDNNKGYVKGNVLIVSHRANSLKRDATLEELQQLVTFMEKHRDGKQHS